MTQFDRISNLKVNINRETELLEACDWDELLVKSLLESLGECIESLNKDPIVIDTYSQFEDQVKKSLSNRVEKHRLEVLMRILKDSLIVREDNN